MGPPFPNPKNVSSKYDFVKVRVQLLHHYYILSRFLVQRMLCVAMVSYKDALRIALRLKKTLVDAELFEIEHSGAFLDPFFEAFGAVLTHFEWFYRYYPAILTDYSVNRA
jgi:hypothetical protein